MGQDGERSERVLARPVGDFLAGTFDLACPGCWERREVPVAELVRYYGGRHLVREVTGRFSCRRCRSVPASVALRTNGDRVVLRGGPDERRVVPFPPPRRRVETATARQADLLDEQASRPRRAG